VWCACLFHLDPIKTLHGSPIERLRRVMPEVQVHPNPFWHAWMVRYDRTSREQSNHDHLPEVWAHVQAWGDRNARGAIQCHDVYAAGNLRCSDSNCNGNRAVMTCSGNLDILSGKECCLAFRFTPIYFSAFWLQAL